MKRAVSAIIVKRDEDGAKVLCIRRAKKERDPLTWEIPRGGVEENETLTQGLIRECKEEVGLDVSVGKLIDTFKYTKWNESFSKKIDVMSYNYFCYMKDSKQEVKLSHEHDSYFWISSYKDAEKIIKHLELKKTLLRAFALLKYEKLQEKSLIRSDGGN